MWGSEVTSQCDGLEILHVYFFDIMTFGNDVLHSSHRLVDDVASGRAPQTVSAARGSILFLKRN